MNLLKPMRLVLVVSAASALLAGCQFLSTTSKSVTSVLENLSDTASSTSGSSGSNKNAFVDTRFEAIRFEAARGEGENLDSLAQLLGETDREAFAQWMHANYARLFNDLAGPEELLARIEEFRHRSG